MLKEFKLPELAEGVESAVVVSISVSVGDKVSKDQPVAELENSKATAEIPVPFEGTVKKIFKAVGDDIQVGETLLSVEVADDTAAASADEKKDAQAEPADTRAEDGPSASLSTAADTELSAPTGTDTASPPPPVAAAKASSGALLPAGPEVRRMARELGVDLTLVKGSGPRGRITPDDIKAHTRSLVSDSKGSSPSATTAADATSQIPQPSLPTFTKWGAIEERPMTGIRRTTAEVTAFSWQQIPHVTQHDLADVTDFKALRDQWRKPAEQADTKLTMTALLLKVTAAALKVFPRFNCSVDMNNRKLIFKKYINLAVAVDAGHGLLTPVIFNADQKSVFEIARELQALSMKAKNKKISIEEMSGSTFAVSNLGALGTTSFGPLVTWPHVAALGVAKAEVRPIWENDAFVPRTMLPLSVSYDHRANDGADAARFLRWICEATAEPMKMIMEAG